MAESNEDQQALQADPSPENVQAFVEYWGEDKLPPGIQAGGDAEPDPTIAVRLTRTNNSCVSQTHA